jgi:hypothetical protein
MCESSYNKLKKLEEIYDKYYLSSLKKNFCEELLNIYNFERDEKLSSDILTFIGNIELLLCADKKGMKKLKP